MLRSINAKLFISIGFATIVIFGVFSYVFLGKHREQHMADSFREISIFSELITRATQFNMPINNRECIHRMMRIIGKQKEVEQVRMFNKKGKIIFSTKDGEIGTFVDMNAESCNQCHMGERPLRYLSESARIRIFNREDYRVLAMTTPIYNEPTCYTASCHVHGKNEAILGTLDIGMSLASVDNEIRDSQLIFILFTVVAITIFVLILAFFLSRLVTSPVRDLVNGTKKVANGDLDIEIPAKTEDEIGQLALSFNHMIKDLKKANEEIKSWNVELEKKVEVRTNKLYLVRMQLIQSEKMASMGILASSVAHEINNPLQGILTYIKLMLKIISGEEVDQKRLADFKKYLQLMGDEIERCGGMVKNLLVFSKQTKLNIEASDINGIVKNSLQLVENKIKLQAIEVETDFQEELPDIFCDVKQIQQTLIALFINAVEAMPKGGKLQISSRDIDKNQVEIVISDSGVGITAKKLKNIFDPFFTTKESAGSTGLGLFVAYGIIKEHKGTIEAHSEVGKGTRFHIKLPVSGFSDVSAQ
ncbi:MAG: HAMP domain-containing protein [bacterium]|nr:HAMP domain-containing protein [bacterium]